MRTSRSTILHEPSGTDRVPESTLAYFRARNKHRLYSVVIGEFKRSGMSQADLARRLGKGTDVVCRWLRSPGNWTADTVSDLLFAISGAEAGYSIRYPLSTSAELPRTTSSGAVPYSTCARTEGFGNNLLGRVESSARISQFSAKVEKNAGVAGAPHVIIDAFTAEAA